MVYSTTTHVRKACVTDNLSPLPPNTVIRAAICFKRWLDKLPYRLLDTLNCRCEVEPPESIDNINDRESAYLAKLSKEAMDPFDTMLGLVALSQDPKAKEFTPLMNLGVPDNQAWRLLKNLRMHGAMITTLDSQIDLMKHADLGKKEQALLTHLKELQLNQDRAATELMELTGYRKEKLTVHVDQKEASAFAKALRTAWERVRTGDDSEPVTILEEELARGRDELRASVGTAEQRKLAADLICVRETFEQAGQIAEGPLARIAAWAVRKLGMDAPADHAAVVAGIVNEKSTAERERLLSSLLGGIAKQIHGTGSSDEVKRAMEEIIRHRDSREPDLAKINHVQSRREIIAAIHDIAGWFPPGVSDEEFKTSVRKAFIGRLSVQRVVDVFRHADAVRLQGRSALFRDALREALAEIASPVLDRIDDCFADTEVQSS
jgi:hypothetical protein